MPYSTASMVELWGQFNKSSFPVRPSSLDYDAALAILIASADGEINEFCHVPQGFFEPGGVTIADELYDGRLLPSGAKKPLTPNLMPILDVSKLEYSDGVTWTTMTEGILADYVFTEDYIVLVNHPDITTYRNIRLNYVAGYDSTPENVATVSAILSAATVQQITDAADRHSLQSGGIGSAPTSFSTLTKLAFTDDLKTMLQKYRLDQVKVYRR